MDDRARQRMALTAEVGKLLKHRSFRDALPPITADGQAPFIVGLLDDTMTEVAAMTAGMGGDVHLVIPQALTAQRRMRVRVLRVTAQDDVSDPSQVPAADCPVDENSTLGMMLSLLEVGGRVACHVFDHETMVQFVTDGMQPVPG